MHEMKEEAPDRVKRVMLRADPNGANSKNKFTKQFNVIT